MAATLPSKSAGMSSYPPTLDIFQKTYDECFAELSKEEKTAFPTCRDSTQLLYEIRKLPVFSCILVQSHPEVAGIVWGLVRGSLLVADTLDSIANKLPQLEDVVNILRSNQKEPSKRLKFALQQGYLDLFLFFRVIRGLFRRENGKSPHTLSIVARLAARPYENRFNDLLKRLEQQHCIVTTEVQIIQLRVSFEQKAVQEHARDLDQQALEAAVMPTLMHATKTIEGLKSDADLYNEKMRDYVQRSESAVDALRQQAANFVDRHDERHDRIGEETNVGGPGNGKSVLAAAAVDELRCTPNSHCYYFFFSEIRGVVQRDNAYRAILAQAFQGRSVDMAAAFEFAMFHTSKGQKTASTLETIDLLRICLDIASDTYVMIFDQARAKLLLFGRPNVIALTHALPTEQRFDIGNRNDPNIRAYFASELGHIQGRKLLPNGTNQLSLENHLLILNVTTPERLNDIYDRIVAYIRRELGPALRQLAEMTLSWLAHSYRPLSATELLESSRLVFTETEEEANDEDSFEKSLVVSCACLVKKDVAHHPPIFRFVHNSAKEFIVHPGMNDEESIPASRARSHAILCRASLQYLLDCIPAHPLGSATVEENVPSALINAYPLCEYSTLHWIFHLERSMYYGGLGNDIESIGQRKARELVAAISRFISTPKSITTWLEVHHVFLAPVDTERLLVSADIAPKALSRSLSASDEIAIEGLLKLGKYLQTLSRDWGTQLMKTPSIVWMECGAFNPSDFIVKNEAMDVHHFLPVAPVPSGLSTVPLKVISVISLGGSHIGTLGIWPSRDYQQVAMGTDQRPSWTQDMIKALQQVTAGWMARYEVWSLSDAPQLVCDVHLPLDANKIWTQICQSLWKDGEGTSADTCRLKCPAAVCKSLRRFSILEIVYTPQASGGNTTCQAHSISLDFNENIKAAWDIKADEFGYKMDAGYGRHIPLDSWIHRNCRLYLYWLWLSIDGRYAFFIDKASSEPSNLAVYDLGPVDAVAAPALINWQSSKLYGGNQPFNCDAATFHPCQPLIVFTVVGSVYLWAYELGASGLDQIYYSFDSFQSVTFTSCGKFVIIKLISESYPIIKELPSKLHEHFQATTTERMVVDPKQTEVGEVSKPNDQLDVIMAGSDTVENNQITLHADGGTEGVEMISGPQNSIQLPGWMAAENTSTTLLPHLRDEKIRMIIEQSRKPWSDLSANGKKGALLVERNRRSINYRYRSNTGVPYSLTGRMKAAALQPIQCPEEGGHTDSLEGTF
ncbi:hypothetical protein K458DRAFT_467542 [Lentithecium fluviatile CBS 122367]|uniref:Nephrocystin 3-like N-terminal domain-containing protein n=1 Tax=Lentithecium fluviatile CBS 122367 TaxID=1168545 RepID=A0A6G1JCY2_9PLEO|nr:hypothetical protein K458DRAFT_467542 [Lentithecium fluviatile CBS 122367]